MGGRERVLKRLFSLKSNSCTDSRWLDSVNVPPLSDECSNPAFDKSILEYSRKPVTPVTLDQLVALGHDAGLTEDGGKRKAHPKSKVSVLRPDSSEAFAGSASNDPLWKRHRRMSSPTPMSDVQSDSLPSRGKLIENANFLRRELPVRLAKRVYAIQNLPFIVGVNPWIRAVRQLYYDSFKELLNFREIETRKAEAEFSVVLTNLVDQHNDTISVLARGFQECKQYMKHASRTKFLDEMIRARIGIRVLAEHYLALHEPFPNWIGIIHTKLLPAHLVQDVASYVANVCELNYGSAPEVEINGHCDTEFAYVPVHLEYMLTEVLKNSMRATVEHSGRIGRIEHPPVLISIGRGKSDISIRVRDQGGGIPYHKLDEAWDYSYTTANESEPETTKEPLTGIFDVAVKAGMVNGSGGPMAGLGFGLPMAKQYAEYFGGSFHLESVFGHGCDAFFTVPNISSLKSHSVNV